MRWRRVKLREVLTQARSREVIDPSRAYRNFGIYSFGRGAFAKPPIDGQKTRAKALFRVRAGQFLYSRLFAFEGAYAVVPIEFDGWYVSNEYPAFDCVAERVSPDFLSLYFRRREVWEKVAVGSVGLGDRRQRVQPEQLLRAEIPLPSLTEQNSMVKRVTALLEPLSVAIALRREAAAETSGLFQAGLRSVFSEGSRWPRESLANLISLVAGQVDPTQEPFASLPHINGDSIESGTGKLLQRFRTAREDGMRSGKYHFPAGAILYSKIRPYLRKAVIVPFAGVCSADVYAIERVDPRVDPAFLRYSLISPEFTDFVTATSGRTRMPKTNQRRLLAYSLPFPSLDTQARVVTFLDILRGKADALKALQEKTAASLRAIVPSILDSAFKGEL